MLFIGHDLPVVGRDRIAVMRQGEICADVQMS
jgi:ABC-type dipeptide/oligopeptide/nickel transport system ATPase component